MAIKLANSLPATQCFANRPDNNGSNEPDGSLEKPLTGPSGPDKTTLLQLIKGQSSTEEGRVVISTSDKDTGLMPQQPDILRGTLRYNLCLHRTCSDNELHNALRLVELDSWFKALPDGFDTWLAQGERLPSGGEQKRPGIIRLLLQDTQILLLDEPFAGVDHTRASRILSRPHAQWNNKPVTINGYDKTLIHPEDLQINPKPISDSRRCEQQQT
ncbi:MAG: ATP-binding cassette domain-containing protein [Pontibacterium sp.]